MELSQKERRFYVTKIVLLGLSFVSLIICTVGGTAHYLKWGWGNYAQPIGWLLAMLFLLLALAPQPQQMPGRLKSLINPRTVLFLFWVTVFVVSHLWNFKTAPWNGNGLFDESGWDLWFLKSYVIGHPYQAAWFHSPISRETLFHYYVWGFLRLFGFNILSYEAALFVIWFATFLFTLLLVDLFFRSYIVTSLTALIFNFLPFAFIYTFAGYRYPLATALCVASLYFLRLGFRTTSFFWLSLGGISAGLCLASSISGKQYLLVLLLCAPLYAAFHWKSLKQSSTWRSVSIIVYGFAAAAMSILLYIGFNHEAYTYYESAFVHAFWQAMTGNHPPHDLAYYTKQFRACFFSVPGPRFFIPDTLPIPMPYYFFLVPGLVLALWQKRFEIALLATIPVAGAFIATSYENRLLLAIPFWVILMAFTFDGLVNSKLHLAFKLPIWAVAVWVLFSGMVPSLRYIYNKTKNPLSIRHYAQQEVAVSRFLKDVVAGKEPVNPPRLERDEFNRTKGVRDAPYDTLICQREAYSIIHLFLHDYGDAQILSFCSNLPFGYVMTEQDVWNANKNGILTYALTNKDLKLIWERDPKTERTIRMFRSLRDLGTEDSISFAFGGRLRTFYVLNIPVERIPQFQQRVSAFPATPGFTSLPKSATNTFQGGKGIGRGQFDSPTGIAVDGSGNVLVADTGNGRIEKFSPTGAFLSIIGTKGSGQGQFAQPNGIAIDRVGDIYVAEIGSKHRVQRLAPDGKFIAEWKGPPPGFYGPRRIAIGPDDSIYVVDSGRNRIAKFSPEGQVLATWGSEGSGDGQFKGVSSVAVDPINSKVYVADPINSRIQVFDSNGRFLTKWAVPEWGKLLGLEDLAIDPKVGRLYASSAHMNAVFIFDLNGTRLGSLMPKPPDKLEGPSALALFDRKLYVLNIASNRVSVIDL
jgi:DNA-binding beta-propeller fold protein YncE